jgi:thioredoxin-dependent peroxiredoxin
MRAPVLIILAALTGCSKPSEPGSASKPSEPTATPAAGATSATGGVGADRPALLAVGDRVPLVTATAHDGTTVELGKPGAPMVIYFYPKDETPGCIAEAEGFRDQLPDAVARGARVVGISVDSLDSHRAFAANRKLTFPLLSDPDGAIATRFGVSLSNGFAERVTFVVAADGTIARVFPKVRVDGHVAEVMAALKQLGGAGQTR